MNNHNHNRTIPNTQTTTSKIRRGCGYRRVGVVYAVASASAIKLQMRMGILCPPLPLEALGLEMETISKRGATPLPNTEGYFYDWVSSDAYPTVAHFLTEILEYGLSVGISMSTALRLPLNAHLVLLHKEAVPTAQGDLETEATCLRDGKPVTKTCCGLHFVQTVERGDIVFGETLLREHSNMMVTYHVANVPIERKPGAFLVVRLTRLEALKANDHDFIKQLQAAKLPVLLTEH